MAGNASTQSERVNLLQRAVNDEAQHSRIVSGMLFGFLVSPSQNQQQAFAGGSIPFEVILQDLGSIVRDNYRFAVEIACRLVGDNFDVFEQ